MDPIKTETKEVDRIPAQVWRLNENKVVKKTFIKDKEVNQSNWILTANCPN